MRQSLSEDIAAVTPSVTSETMTDRPWQGMTLFADRINASGVDDLYIETGSLDAVGKSALLFDGDVTLSTRGSIRIGTALLGMHSSQEAAVNLESAYIGFNSALPPTNVSAPVPLAQTATADLTIRADLIDLFGQLNLGCGLPACVDAEMAAGFDVARFESTGDIRLAPLGAANVGLYSGGGLVFDAAQVYTASQRTQSPTSNNHGDGAASYPGFVIESAQSVEFIGNGAPAPTPLSFGERLTVRAPVIVQGGVLRAPQGQVRLEATESVTLLPGSLTSASLDGLTVPFGEVAVGGLFPGYGQPGWTPEKSVRLSGPEVNVAAGAVLDVSGGGDLLGWSFSPGNGGSNNILAFAADTPRFAILPSLGSAPAPIHPSPRSGANPLADVRLSVGDTIWLADVPGLAPGYYTLLPAHYALLDGGLLIEPMGGATAGPLPSVEQPDGSLLVSGYRARGDQGRVRDPAYGRFKVMTRRVIEQYSEISRYSFNEYAKVMGEAAGVMARTPSDAGSLVLAATETLRLEGTGRFGVDEGGLLGNLDIAAQRIAITAAAGQAPEGYLSIDATELSSFGAGSILVGGSRSAGATGTAIEVSADSVIVDNDAGSPLTGLEFIFAANEDITVGEGAYIVVSGAESLDANTLELNGDGALMRVSAARRVGLDRTAGSGHAGDVRVHGGADVSGRSISLEGSRTIELSRDARLDAEEVDLASMRVNLGNVPEDEPGVTLGLEMLERLGFATDLLIRGHESIQLHGSFELGARGETGPTLGSLTLDTARLRGRGSEVDTVGITAGGLVLRNSGAAASPTDSGSARLALDVDSLRLESGEVRLTGFEAIQGSAGAVVIDGRGSLVADGALSLSAGRITSGSGADYALHVGGDLRVERGVRIDEGENASPTVDALGGRLAMSGASLSLDTAVVLPAGTLSLTAASGNLTLGDAAMLDLSGVARDFRDVVKFAPGGRVELTAAADVVVREGAVIDVSGSDRGGPSGRLGIEAGRAAIIRGTLQATTVADRAGGEFALDAGTIDDFSALNAQLNAGGFDAARAIRVRTQDLTLAAGERIDAHTVTLRSDEGAVRIAGTIAAGGSAVAAQGGDVRLIGGSGVVLESTARIEAAAAEVDQPALAPSSGTVELVATSGRVDVADGALVDVSGGREGGGRIVVRAERTGDGLAVGRLDGEFRGARARSLVGVASYEAEEIDAALAAQMLSEATGWLSDAAPVPEWTLGAGMRVRSTGDLRVGSDVDLAGQIGAGWLGLEAAGDLHIDAAISDGFADSARDAALLTAPSAGYDFESGGDLVVGAGGMIRTGTGDIRLDVGRNLVLADNSSVIYTAGAKTAPRAGFDLTSSRGLPPG
ncbi:MAG: filamentous hemagglutinin, partial [Proteobacteria bacterium]